MTDCPSESEIVGFAEGMLQGEARERIEAHLDGCSVCILLLGEAGWSKGSVPARPRVRPGEFLAGKQVGRYILRKHVGSGGMGAVFLAHDPHLQRDVAIKLLLARHELTPLLRRRIIREGRTLARLHHRHVLSVFDVGIDDGQAYVATAFIAGQTLSRWLEEKSPDWRSICKVFIQAGEGLVAAHAAGIIHRDFKPSNVMIDETGAPVIVDFGLAMQEELHEPEVVDPTDPFGSGEMDATRTGAAVGTPAYMAPEQHAGRPALPASDQYAFCLALYEALYEQYPFDTTQGRYAAKLSGVLSFPRARGVPRWFQPILRRGLCPDPEGRWPSMQALVAALTAKTRRRTTWVAPLTGGVLVTTVGAGLWADERRKLCSGASAAMASVWHPEVRAELETAFLGTGVSYAPGVWERVAPELDAWAAKWKKMHTEACEATRIRHEQSEEAMDLRMGCLGRAKASFRAAIGVLATPTAQVLERADHLVASLPTLATCADIEALTTDVPPPSLKQAAAVVAAREAIDQAVAKRRAGLSSDALDELKQIEARVAEIGYGPLESEVSLEIAMVHLGIPQYVPELEEQLRKALRTAIRWRQWDVVRSAALELMQVVSKKTSNRGEVALLRDWAESLTSEAISERLELYDGIGAVLADEGDGEAAEAMSRKALRLRIETYGPDHISVAPARSALALNLTSRGDYKGAESELREAIRISEALQGADHPATAAFRSTLGSVLSRQGEHRQAVEQLRASLATREKLLPATFPKVLLDYARLAESLHWAGDVEASEEALERLTRLRQNNLASDSPEAADIHSLLGNLYEAKGDLEASAREMHAALALRLQHSPPNHPVICGSRHNLAVLYLAQKRYEDAETEGRAGLACFLEQHGEDHPHTAAALLLVATTLRHRGHPEEAIEPLERAWAIVGRSQTPPSRKAQIMFELAQTLWSRRSERRRAVELAKDALETFRTLPVNKVDSADIQRWLSTHRL